MAASLSSLDAAGFISGFNSFLTFRAGFGVHPDCIDDGRIVYGIERPSEGQGHRLLDLPHIPMVQTDKAFLQSLRPFDSGAGRLVERIISQHGIGDFHLERDFVQKGIDSSLESVAALPLSPNGFQAEAIRLHHEVSRLMQGIRLTPPGPSPAEFAATSDAIDLTRENWISLAQSQIMAAAMYARAGGDENLTTSARLFLHSSGTMSRQRLFSAAGLAAQAARKTLQMIPAAAGNDVKEAAVLAANSFSRSLACDPDPMTYGLRIFLGLSEGWYFKEAMNPVLKMLFRSYRFNLQQHLPRSAAGDLMRVSWILLKNHPEVDATAWRDAADSIKAAALMLDNIGMDEKMVAVARKYAESAAGYAMEASKQGIHQVGPELNG